MTFITFKSNQNFVAIFINIWRVFDFLKKNWVQLFKTCVGWAWTRAWVWSFLKLSKYLGYLINTYLSNNQKFGPILINQLGFSANVKWGFIFERKPQSRCLEKNSVPSFLGLWNKRIIRVWPWFLLVPFELTS